MKMSLLDTLYISHRCSRRDFLLICDSIIDDLSECHGTSDGYSWYSYRHGRLGITTDYDISKRANNPQFRFQFDWSYLSQLPLDSWLLNLPEPPFGSFSDWKIYRVDMNYTVPAAYYPVVDHYVSPFRSKTTIIRDSRGNPLTVYLGSRSAGSVCRIYRKDVELRETNNYEKIDFFPDIPLTTIELEMRNKFLTRRFGHSHITLDLLPQIYRLFNLFVGSIRAFSSLAGIARYNSGNYDSIDYDWFGSTLLSESPFFPTPAPPHRPRSWDHTFKRFYKILESYANYSGKTTLELLDRIALRLFADQKCSDEVVLDLVEKYIHQPSFDYYQTNFRYYFLDI